MSNTADLAPSTTDRVRRKYEADLNNIDHFLPRSEVPESGTVDSSVMELFRGVNDVSIVYGGSCKDDGSPLTLGQFDFETEKSQAEFRKNEDGTYSIKGEDGKTYTVEMGRHDQVKKVTDETGNLVEAKVVLEISDKVESLIQKQKASDVIDKIELDEEQQEIFECMVKAMAANNFETMEKLALRFSDDPSRFGPVFTKLVAEKLLSGIEMDIELFVGKNNSVFMAGNGSPELIVFIPPRRQPKINEDNAPRRQPNGQPPRGFDHDPRKYLLH